MSGTIRRYRYHPLPADFAATLRALRETDRALLDATLAAAHANGWTQRALGEALGISRQAVEQRIKFFASARADIPGFPLPPRPEKPIPVPPARLELKPELIEDLRRMYEIAKSVNGATPVESKARRISEQFSAQLAAYVEQGVTVYYLAQALGTTYQAIGHRLGRHGYRAPCPSQAHNRYRNRTNRVTRAA